MKKFDDAEEISHKLEEQERQFEAQKKHAEDYEAFLRDRDNKRALDEGTAEQGTPVHNPAQGTPSTPVIRIAIQNQVGNTKIINFETYVDQVTPVPVINALVDRLMAVSDRQHEVYRIKDLELQEAQLLNQIAALEESIGKLSEQSTTHVEGKRNPQENKKIAADIQNMRVNIEHTRKNIIKTRSDIAQARKAIS